MTEAIDDAQETAARIDEEDIRLTTGFADIFTAIMLVVGAVALNALTGLFGGLLTAVAAVALTPALVQRRQFAASAIILSLSVAAGTIILTAFAGVGSFFFCAIAVTIYGFVFNIPIAKALGWIAAVATIALIGIEATQIATFRALFAGLALFTVAMRYDSADRMRQTRRSDVAFWLHLAAAPLIVHGLFTLIGVNPFFGLTAVTGTHAQSIGLGPQMVLPIFAALTLVALIVDRRPILASSISYLFAAVGGLLNIIEPSREGGAVFLKFALAPGIIGLGILVLAAVWTPLRARLLAFVPDAIARHVPPASAYAPPRDTAIDRPVAESEPLRLVLGFNDLFVAMGCGALFVSSLVLGAYLSWTALDGARPTGMQVLHSPHIWYPVLLPAIAIWAAAEYFVRGRRMAWPAVTLAFDLAIVAAMAGWLLALSLGIGDVPSSSFGFGRPIQPPTPGRIVALTLLACAVGVVANLAFWRRQRVPVSFAFAVAALIPLLFVDQTAAAWSSGGGRDAFANWPWRLAAGGIAVFALALFWDRSDAARQTQRADTAFWLHLLASLLVIPALSALAMRLEQGWTLVLAGFAALILLAVMIDRRAPLVVAMPFAVWALGERVGGGIVTLGFAAALLALALKWDEVRRFLLERIGRLPLVQG